MLAHMMLTVALVVSSLVEVPVAEAAGALGGVVAVDDGGAFVDDGLLPCAVASAVPAAAGAAGSAASASCAPATPIVDAINPDTSVFLSRRIMARSSKGEGSETAAGTLSLLQGLCHAKPLIRGALFRHDGHRAQRAM